MISCYLRLQSCSEQTAAKEQAMKEQTFSIQGMSCGHCVRSVTGALEAIPGVQIKKVVVGQADISYDETKTNDTVLIHAIEEEGFQVTK
jgi:copper chaperone